MKMLTIAPENRHRESGGTRDADPQLLARANDLRPSPKAQPPIVFNDHERRALELIGDDPQTTLATAIATALELIGSERDHARVTLTGKLIAMEVSRQLDLARLIDQLTMCRDLEAIAVFDRRLTNSTKRLCLLLAEHRASCAVGNRAAIVVGHADTVNVKAGR